VAGGNRIAARDDAAQRARARDDACETTIRA
jgi:hypothetical protein